MAEGVISIVKSVEVKCFQNQMTSDK